MTSVKEGRGDSLLPEVAVTNKNPLRNLGDEPSRQKQQCVWKIQTRACVHGLFARWWWYLLVSSEVYDGGRGGR